MQGVIAIALMAQVVTVLEPEYRLLLRPEIQQRVQLTSSQIKKINDAMSEASRAYNKMPPAEKSNLGADAPLAKAALVTPSLHRLGLTKKQKSMLVAITADSYGPYLLHMPGFENYVRISQTQKVSINRDFAAVAKEFNPKFVELAQKSKVKYTVGGTLPLTPPFQLLRSQRDRSLWTILLKHLTGPQIMRVILVLKYDPWTSLKSKSDL